MIASQEFVSIDFTTPCPQIGSMVIGIIFSFVLIVLILAALVTLCDTD